MVKLIKIAFQIARPLCSTAFASLIEKFTNLVYNTALKWLMKSHKKKVLLKLVASLLVDLNCLEQPQAVHSTL